jgi:hypothetical protein
MFDQERAFMFFVPEGEALSQEPVMPPEMARTLCAALSSPRLRLEPLDERHAPAFYPALVQDDALYRWISMSPPESEAQLAEHWRCLTQSGYRSPDGLCAWPTWAAAACSAAPPP